MLKLNTQIRLRGVLRDVIVEDRGGFGFVYIGEDDRVVWIEREGVIHVNNHSNWGEISPRVRAACATELRRIFPDATVIEVDNMPPR